MGFRVSDRASQLGDESGSERKVLERRIANLRTEVRELRRQLDEDRVPPDTARLKRQLQACQSHLARSTNRGQQAEAKCEVLASWLETVLWVINNPNRAGEGMNVADATRALHDFDPEAARRVNPGLASLYDKVKAP